MKNEINSITFILSKNTDDKIKEIDIEKENLIDELQKRLCTGGISPHEARQLCGKVENKCKDFEIVVQEILEKALKEECYFQLDCLREKYQVFITNILKEAFPQNENIQKLELSVLQMPNTGEMISDNTRPEYYEVKVERSKWNPMRWFGSKYTTEERERDIVDLKPFYNEVSDSIRNFTQDNIRKFRKEANKDLDVSKEQLIFIMDSKLQEMKKIEQAITLASKNKAEKEAQKQDAEMKIAWFKEFHTELNKILTL